MNTSPALAIPFEWPLVIGEMLAFAVSMCALIVITPDGPDYRISAPSALRALRLITLAGAIWAPIALAHEVAQMASTTIYESFRFIPEAIAETHAGRLGAIRIGAFAAMLVLLLLAKNSRIAIAAAAAISALLMFIGAAASHAIDSGVAAVAIYWLHELSAAIWLSALLAFVLMLNRPDLKAPQIESASAKLSAIAGWSLGALVLSGLYAAWRGIGLSVDHLLFSAYGRTLLFKLSVAAPLILIGGFNRWRLLPIVSSPDAAAAMRRNVIVECGMIALVLALSSVLAATAPAH